MWGFLPGAGSAAAGRQVGLYPGPISYSFDFNNKNWEYLARLQRDLDGLPLVVEFRNARWLKVEVFQWLRKQDIGFCCVDEPQLPNLMPPVAEATGKIAYVRFHGRNKEKWWQPEQAWERYDYSYKAGGTERMVAAYQKIGWRG